MSKKPIKPGHQQIVIDFDKWLFENVPGFLDKNNFTVVKEITNKWRELRNGYFYYLLKEVNRIRSKLT